MPKRDIFKSVNEYVKASARHTRELITRWKIESWDVSYLRILFDWAGHVAHMVTYDDSRIALVALKLWDWQHLVNTKALCGKQCHRRNLHIWRWEQNIYKYFEAGWLDNIGRDKQAWKDSSGEWLKWRC